MRIIAPQDRSELRNTLAVLMDRPELTTVQLNASIDWLLHYASRRGLSLDHCLLAVDGDRQLGACLCIDSPGHMSSLFLPARKEYLEPVAAASVVCEAVQRAGQRGVRFVQAMTEPEADDEAEVYRRAGFRFITCLAYMDRYAALPQSLDREPPPVEWQTYTSPTHRSFAEVIEATYQDSLDCAAINGLRDIEDIMASHKAAGEFDPATWFLGSTGGEPIGVLLLSRVLERSAYEVVYMGLLPARRGRGYAVTFLRQALSVAREAGVLDLTLTVDEQNLPARRLYERFGFVQSSRRNVWMNAVRNAEGSE